MVAVWHHHQRPDPAVLAEQRSRLENTVPADGGTVTHHRSEMVQAGIDSFRFGAPFPPGNPSGDFGTVQLPVGGFGTGPQVDASSDDGLPNKVLVRGPR